MALIFQQLTVSFLTPIWRHADLPGPREDLRVLDRDFVEQVIRARGRVPLYRVQGNNRTNQRLTGLPQSFTTTCRRS